MKKFPINFDQTDFDFNTTILKFRNDLMILPRAIEWKSDLSMSKKVKMLEIPWDNLQDEVKDRGSYLLVLKLERHKLIEIGRLGKFMFQKGYYIYVGSAMSNLRARIKRHKQKRKKMHWHIDYLTRVTDGFLSIPIRSSQRQECEIAQALSSILKSGPAGFGSSDCKCLTHLFWSEKSPLQMETFHNALQRFRIKHP
ncbi:MAG: hypothetical protein DRG73_04740 [Deltaproteobacteria bacterium]|nr:MAG: hypothetical protein DRG73_04740 [Deltaproteobacteria bacterium]